MFCENDMELDQYCRRVVRKRRRHLNEGGFFQAVLEWVQVSGQSWQERLSEWLEGSGCDAWVLRSYIRDAAGYARERIRETLPDESYSDKMDAWMEYYRQRGVEEIHGGILAMRRRSGRNWLRLEGTPVEATTPFGNLVLETFATQDILHDQPDDAALLAMCPRLPEGAELDQRFRMQGGAWAPASLHILLTGAAPAQSAVEREVAGFLGRCNGTSTLPRARRRTCGHCTCQMSRMRARNAVRSSGHWRRDEFYNSRVNRIALAEKCSNWQTA